MHGWTDPIDPDGARRRPQPPAGEPAWLTDRPEPRSAYLFGDEPGTPAEEPRRGGPAEPWRDHPAGVGRDEPTESWRDERARGWGGEPTGAWREEPTGSRPDEPGQPWRGHSTGSWRDEPTGVWRDQPGQPWRDEPTGTWRDEQVSADPGPPTRFLGPVDQPYRVGAAPAGPDWPEPESRPRRSTAADGGEGRHRQGGRFRRPMVIGGAAAAATLVVSLGVAALALPGGDGERSTERTAADVPVATAPAEPDTLAADAETPSPAPTSAAPSAAPTTSRPAPTPTPSRAATPAPDRTTAASRGAADRISPKKKTSAPTASPSRTSTGTTTSSGLTAELQKVVDLVNQERAKAGCQALSVDGKLTQAAQAHSQDQADHRKMSHDGSDGSDAGARLDRVGYAWRAYGENVAWNQQSPEAVMDAWMNSPGHRANILNCGFTEIGVGVARSNGPYWTQDFGTPR
ncbi:CAP domain-containing protein [Micromonospora sp. NPDC050686]|uniref:CAP domain-containing protein n=1 Tax=Micromonospora sp. NPDC050686 TaxID=3154631 RepID=UPI0033FE0F87